MTNEDTQQISDAQTKEPEVVDVVATTAFDGKMTIAQSDEPDTASDRTGSLDQNAQAFVYLDDLQFDELERNTSTGRLSREERYRAYTKLIDDIPEVRRAVEIYADYIASGSAIETTPGDKGSSKVYQVKFEDDGDLLEDELREVGKRLGMASKVWDITYNLVGWGDDFIEQIYQADGMSRLHRLPRDTMFRRETSDGRFDPDAPFRQRNTYVSQPYAMLDNSEINFAEWQVGHFRMVSDLQTGYGVGILASLIPTGNEISLIESALTIARLTKAHRRLLFGVDVGKQQGMEAERAVNAVRSKFKKRRTFDPSTGKLNIYRNPLLEEEDIFFGVGEGGMSSVSQLPGDPTISQIDDVLHKYDRLLAGLRIPKAWLGLTGPNIRNVIDEQVLSFMRACRRIRSYLERTLSEIYINALVSYGVSYEFLRDKTLTYEWPSMTHADDEAYLRMQTMRAKLGLIYKGAEMVPDEAIMRVAFGWEEDKVVDYMAAMDAQRVKQAKLAKAMGLPPSVVPKKPTVGESNSLSLEMSETLAKMAEEQPGVAEDLQDLKSAMRDVMTMIESQNYKQAFQGRHSYAR